MSDLLIRGMELSMKGVPIQFQIWPDGQVDVFERGEYWSVAKAVNVPPHGRLKDYDRIMKEYDEWFSKTESREYENMFYALRMAINGSPTIIPASK